MKRDWCSVLSFGLILHSEQLDFDYFTFLGFSHKTIKLSRAPSVLTIGWRQEDKRFKDSLCYIGNLRAAWGA